MNSIIVTLSFVLDIWKWSLCIIKNHEEQSSTIQGILWKKKNLFFFFANLGWETTEETKPEMHECEGKILIEEIA